MAAAKIMARLCDVPPLYTRILSKYPKNVKFCFAYGSAVKQQTGSEATNQMIDFVYCVQDPASWHRENIEKNGRDYSSLKYLGGRFVAGVQENFGARVYFNTLVPVEEEGVTIKYGVVSGEDLIADLLDWRYLYMAGRLHKPVKIVQLEPDASLQGALRSNLFSAVHVSLLLMPEQFTDYELYHTISNISYSGDFRMKFGENKKKVENIVTPQLNAFHKLYEPVLNEFKACVSVSPQDNSGRVRFHQDVSPVTKLYHLRKLPFHLRTLVESRATSYSRSKDSAEDPMMTLANSPVCRSVLNGILDQIVWHSSVRQSLKGILTAGMLKSVNYSARKIKKMF